VYRDIWRFRLNYTIFLGPEGTYLDQANHLSFQQSLKDRNYLSFSAAVTL
jgi:prephenate dehydratase